MKGRQDTRLLRPSSPLVAVAPSRLTILDPQVRRSGKPGTHPGCARASRIHYGKSNLSTVVTEFMSTEDDVSVNMSSRTDVGLTVG